MKPHPLQASRTRLPARQNRGWQIARNLIHRNSPRNLRSDEKFMLCQFAHDFPESAGRFLDRAATLGRQFREETLTDVLMGAMVAFRRFGVEVSFPDEPRTGADMEWLFVRDDGSSYFRLILQAKKLHDGGQQWSRRSYPEIFHRVKSTGVLQSDTLIAEARSHPGTLPLYVFYTHQSICDLATAAGCPVLGLALASGFVINQLVNDKLSGKKTPHQTSSLKAIYPHMFPLSRVLCGGRTTTLISNKRIRASGVMFLLDRELLIPLGGVPTPEQVRMRLAETLGADIPEVGEGRPLPDAGDTHSSRSRFRVIFRSPGRADEERLLRILPPPPDSRWDEDLG